jgi:hypothetical protein
MSDVIVEASSEKVDRHVMAAAELKAVRETARDRERELQRENDLLRSEVEALRAGLEGREASQSQSATAPAARVIELMTDEDRQRLEREGQQRLPLEWEIDAECSCRPCTSQDVAREFSVAAE